MTSHILIKVNDNFYITRRERRVEGRENIPLTAREARILKRIFGWGNEPCRQDPPAGLSGSFDRT